VDQVTVFYLGAPMPSWLADSDVPLYVSHNRLRGRKTLPRARVGWGLDSGAYMIVKQHGGWPFTPQEYVAGVARYDVEIGNLEWAAPMDWPCEDDVLRATGLTITDHQRLTVENYRRCFDAWWDANPEQLTGWGHRTAEFCPIMPVLQGRTRDDYLRHVDMYAAAGMRLEEWPVVGLGSVCRLQATREAEHVVRELTPFLALHGFGVKLTGLARFGHRLESADSQAWSFAGKRLPGCTPTHQAENNCRRWALEWRGRALDRIATSAARPDQLILGELAA
jgi:hypothetical protein